ncbi:MAG: fumarylacetoacetate hydrolase family protein [Bacteroidia bacterium]
MKPEIQKAADILWEAHNTKSTVPPVREIISADDIDAAYATQEITVKRRMANGEKVVGKKIGLTSFAVMEQLGVDQPDYGVLFNTMEVQGGKLAYSELVQPKAEAEIAFMMGEDLEGDFNITDLIDAIAYATVSIEVVGSRVADWNICITDTIADNASASHFILGETKVDLDDLDLVDCQMKLTKNGEVASEGSGAACMDNPLNAALWLAQTMAEQGNPLRKGEVLLSGALGPMVPIAQGDEFIATIEGLGSVSLKIE